MALFKGLVQICRSKEQGIISAKQQILAADQGIYKAFHAHWSGRNGGRLATP